MSQIEHAFRAYLSKHPEIEKCYQTGLINRRALARHLVRQGVASPRQLEATIAMVRRFPFSKHREDADLFQDIRIMLKDDILILDFTKEKELVQWLQKVVAHTDYDRGDTLKVVVGSASVKVFVDRKNEETLKAIVGEFDLKHRLQNVSEISLLFPESAIKSKGILAALTRELALHDIAVTEILTSSPELLIYVKEEHVLKAYEIIKRLRGESATHRKH